MNHHHIDTLGVPGATLHYESRGQGPTLLLISGGAGDADVLAPLATALADRYTTVTFDPRGLSRSPMASPQDDHSVTVHADDAERLLSHVGGEEAYVFGTSGGAVVALELLARHPQRLRRVVAHEPPCYDVLPEAERHRAAFDKVRSAFHTAGAPAAMTALGEIMGDSDEAGTPEHFTPETLARMNTNMPVFLGQILGPFTGHRLALPRLREHRDRLVMAAGLGSRGLFGAAPANALATALPTPLAEFPGGHLGAATSPTRFATRLAETLTPERS